MSESSSEQRLSSLLSNSSSSSSITPSSGRSSSKHISYYYDDDIGNYYYGRGHPMKPNRVRMTHSLIVNYDLYRHMEIVRPYHVPADFMKQFHSSDYIDFLTSINVDNVKKHMVAEQQKYKINAEVDCPVFDGLFEYCQTYTGGSVGGAYKLLTGNADIAINWAGGLHHAKKSEASGFCYVNDIVLAILELLKKFDRVLYIDIDVHHGDGVEEAFYTTDRVMTLSMHKYGDFFPGTGALEDVGEGKGMDYSLNFPLDSGITDERFVALYKEIVNSIMEHYRPSAIVLQCGADSLSGDRLGIFNLSSVGHAECVQFTESFNVPLLVLGGGGYTPANVARCWTLETSVLLHRNISNTLPHNEFYQCYTSCNHELLVQSKPSMPDSNTKMNLEATRVSLLEILRRLPVAPSVQYSLEVPRDELQLEERASERRDNQDPDVRVTEEEMDKRRSNEGDFYDDNRD